MKRSILGMVAFFAVCSLLLTGCYEKTNVKVHTPSEYYVLGSIFDAETGEIITNATVTVEGKSVASTFKVKLDSYVPTVTVVASAEGYGQGTRVVTIEKMSEYNEVSYTGADMALFKLDAEPEPDAPVVSKPEIGTPVVGASGVDAAAIKKHFGIGAHEVKVDSEGNVEVYAHYAFVDGHLNVGTNVTPNMVLGSTDSPYTVVDSLFSGYIWNYTKESNAVDMRIACNDALNSLNVGTQYKDFGNTAKTFSYVLNENSSMTLVGYCVCKDFTLWTIPYTVEGEIINVLALQAKGTHITPIESNNDGGEHTNGGSHHNHDAATAWGGGAGDAE